MELVSKAKCSHALGGFYPHLKTLLSIPSITPSDNGCQEYIQTTLEGLGFECRRFFSHGVSNLIARLGHGPTRVAFSGHTDVVPVGDKDAWLTDPFAGEIMGDEIVGRGVADMKGGIAAMLAAVEARAHTLDLSRFSVYFLITSDEEGEADFGTKEIMAYLKSQDELPHLCIVGEPTADKATGDVIKVGRRGAISADVIVSGKQGHVAYPQFAENAAHKVCELGKVLTSLTWDSGSCDFPGTSLQITGIDTGQWTDNIIPGRCTLSFNVRFSHKYSEQDVKNIVEQALTQCIAGIEISWSRSCTPYFTSSRPHEGISLVKEVEQAVYQVTQRFPRLSTSGGTSDGRFIASESCQVIELGVPNSTIHQINERVKVADLQTLERLYTHLLKRLEI